MIKIVTGLRRSGKSFLLFKLFRKCLLDNGLDEEHIIAVALDDRLNADLRNPDNMLRFIHSRIKEKDKQYYILLDEVQIMDEFVDVLNSLLHIDNAQVYVTGSNSRFLSRDVATEFRGRGYEIHVYPLSFAEFYSACGKKDLRTAWREYYTYGGLPQLLDYDDERAKQDFLRSLMQSVYVRDVIERHHIKNQVEFEELMAVVASTTGSMFNATRLSNTFATLKGLQIDKKTVDKYVTYMSDAFIVEKSARYDIRGKKYIGALSKYYFQDVGIRNALLNFRQQDVGHLMENVLYNELRMRGYRVDVGQIEQRATSSDGKTIKKTLEVDFVLNRGNQRLYIQSAYAMPDTAKREQEEASLMKINDGFRKIIIVGDDIAPYWNEQGIYIVGLFDVLLSPDSLDRI